MIILYCIKLPTRLMIVWYYQSTFTGHRIMKNDRLTDELINPFGRNAWSGRAICQSGWVFVHILHVKSRYDVRQVQVRATGLHTSDSILSLLSRS